MFQVLIGILTIFDILTNKLSVSVVSSPYRYSNNDGKQSAVLLNIYVSSPYRYSNNQMARKNKRKLNQVSSPYRYSNN